MAFLQDFSKEAMTKVLDDNVKKEYLNVVFVESKIEQVWEKVKRSFLFSSLEQLTL